MRRFRIHEFNKETGLDAQNLIDYSVRSGSSPVCNNSKLQQPIVQSQREEFITEIVQLAKAMELAVD
jgi:hypothetical protein